MTNLYIFVQGKKLVETKWVDDSSLENGFASLENYTYDISMNTRKSNNNKILRRC